MENGNGRKAALGVLAQQAGQYKLNRLCDSLQARKENELLKFRTHELPLELELRRFRKNKWTFDIKPTAFSSVKDKVEVVRCMVRTMAESARLYDQHPPVLRLRKQGGGAVRVTIHCRPLRAQPTRQLDSSQLFNEVRNRQLYRSGGVPPQVPRTISVQEAMFQETALY